MKKLIEKLANPIKILIISAAFIVFGQYALAQVWNEPSCGPTGCNTPTPINVGSTPQAKNGQVLSSTLNIGGTLSSDNLSVFSNGYVGGNLGVGTSNPSQKLDVNGSINIVAGGYLVAPGRLHIQSSEILYLNPHAQGSEVVVGGGGGNGKLSATEIWSNAFYYRSDAKLRNNIKPLENSLSKILGLEGMSFNWNESGKAGIGLVAQDVEKVYPDLVTTDSRTGTKSVQYANLVAPLIEAIKEQQKQIEDLKKEVEELKNK